MNKGDIVKLVDGRRVTIVSLPTSFMANGSYEVLHSDAQVKFWVKSEDILYIIDEENDDDLNNYFEVIFDKSGLNLIPKNIVSIDIESDREDINRIKLTFTDNTNKHQICNIHVGGTTIKDLGGLTEQSKEEEKSKIEKIVEIIKTKKDNEVQ
jgi:hypothetical protein